MPHHRVCLIPASSQDGLLLIVPTLYGTSRNYLVTSEVKLSPGNGIELLLLITTLPQPAHEDSDHCFFTIHGKTLSKYGRTHPLLCCEGFHELLQMLQRHPLFPLQQCKILKTFQVGEDSAGSGRLLFWSRACLISLS